MRWWTLPALLVTLAAGYLLGSLDSDQGAGRAQRADHAPQPAAQVALPGRVATAPTDPVPAAGLPELVVAAPDPAAPPEDDESEYGTLVVDFEGFDGPEYVRVEAADLDGNYDYLEEGADEDGKAWIQLAPGEVTVRWESRGALRRYAARAVIEAGRVTLLRAADEGHAPLPEPPGSAVLDVRVSGPDGRPLADATVHLGGNVLEGTRWLTVATDGEGRARFRVKGGSYEVQAGERSDKVSLASGERRALELRHDAYGMVVVDPALEGIYALHPREGGSAPTGARDEGHAVRFLFVPAGGYELWYTFSTSEFAPGSPRAGVRYAVVQDADARPDRRLVATLEVRAGRVERIPHPPEPGFLEVEVAVPEPAAGRRWQMRVRGQGDQGNGDACPLEVSGGVVRGRTGQMANGVYRVEILADGKVVAERGAVVGYGPTQIDKIVWR